MNNKAALGPVSARRALPHRKPSVWCLTSQLALAIVGASNLQAQSTNCLPPPPGMVAWYPLDEPPGATAVLDVAPAPFSAVPDTGTPVPAPVQGGGPVSVPGKVGTGALYFFGPYVRVPHSTDLVFPGSFSIDAWIRVVDCGWTGGGALAGIADKWDPSAQIGFSFFVDQPTPTTGWLKLQMNNAVFTSTTTLPTGANPPANTGPWVHVAVTVDAANQMGTFYINGAPAGTFLPPAGSISNNLDLQIGRARLPGGMCELAIDELELFDRALTPQEVLALYMADAAGKCRPGPKPDATLCVEKFHDLNGNGVWEPNEPPLAGWQFVVTDPASNVVGMITTSPPGTPPGCLALAAGTYVVSEVLQPGWMPTTPLSQTITVSSGQTVSATFGNRNCLQTPAGMVAWYPMDDATNQSVVMDLVAANHGTAKNSANVPFLIGLPTLWQLPDPAVFGGSLSPVVVDPGTSPPRGAFFFSDTCVEVPHQPQLNVGTNGLTLTLWVWPTPGSGAPQPLVEKFDPPNLDGYSWYLDWTGSNHVMQFNLNGTLVTGPVLPLSLNPSNWWFVVARISPSGAVMLAACDMGGNCTNTPAVTVPGFQTTNTQPLWISRGLVPSATGVMLQGIRIGMDELEIFDRALSTAELYSIYTNELAGLRKCHTPSGPAEVCIVKFHDLNASGQPDPGEPTLAGWQFVVNPPPPGWGTNIVTTSPGGICFGVTAPVTLTITEIPQPGWSNTTPATQTLTVLPGQLTNVYFGNQGAAGRICVLKYHDLNMNGVQDTNEPALAGWTIQIKDNVGNVLQTVQTQTNPVCVQMPPGTYTVSEVLPPPVVISPNFIWTPWIPTAPPGGTYSNVTILPGQSISLSFGNRKNLKIVNPAPPSPTHISILVTAEPGLWYQLQYKESLDNDVPWKDWGAPVRADGPSVLFRITLDPPRRPLFVRGLEIRDIR